MRYRVTTDGLSYPVGDSLARVRAAGGLSRMTDDERAALTIKRAERGTVVDDVPETSVSWLLEQGLIEAVESPAPLPWRPAATEPEE